MEDAFPILNAKKVIFHLDDVVVVQDCDDIELSIFILAILDHLFHGIELFIFFIDNLDRDVGT